MEDHDKAEFVAKLTAAWRMWDDTPSAEKLAQMWNQLKNYPLDEVVFAMDCHTLDYRGRDGAPEAADLIWMIESSGNIRKTGLH